MSKPTNPRFTARDRTILEAIYAYDGMLTDVQIQALFFPTSHAGRNKTVRLFMQRLIDTGYVVAANAQQRAQLRYCAGCMVYWLSRKGATTVAEFAGVPLADINWRKPDTRWGQADHDILTNDVRIQLFRACQASDEFSLHEWIPARLFAADFDTVTYEIKLRSRTIKRERRVLPDSLAVIVQHGQSPSRFPIELDLSTNSQARIMREKIHAGLAWIKSREYKRRFGDNTGRWLYLMESERRMRNLQELVGRELGYAAAAFYFATLDQVQNCQVLTDPIWYHGTSKTPQPLATHIKQGA